jgi:hypothetical protein
LAYIGKSLVRIELIDGFFERVGTGTPLVVANPENLEVLRLRQIDLFLAGGLNKRFPI